MLSTIISFTRNPLCYHAKVAVISLLLLAPMEACTRKTSSNRIPEKAREVLNGASQLTLFSIDPNLVVTERPDSEMFHRYRILGKLELSNQESRRQVAQQLQKDILDWDGNYVMCFNPRHAIRAVSGSITYDFLICYECERVELYSGSELVRTLGIAESLSFDKLLNASHIPIAK